MNIPKITWKGTEKRWLGYLPNYNGPLFELRKEGSRVVKFTLLSYAVSSKYFVKAYSSKKLYSGQSFTVAQAKAQEALDELIKSLTI